MLELPGRVGGGAAVHRARLEDRAAGAFTKPKRWLIGAEAAAPPAFVAGTHPLDEGQRVADLVEVQARVER